MTISIMMILTVVILVRNSAFNGAVLLRNQAYEIAFALRQAQLLAVSGTRAGNDMKQQYGVYVTKSSSDNQSYIIFHDVDHNGRWNSTSDTQIGPIGHLDSRFRIRAITDSDTPTPITPDAVSVTFLRPNFDALLESGNGTVLTSPLYIDIAQVNAAAGDLTVGAVRRVAITGSGQISVTEYSE